MREITKEIREYSTTLPQKVVKFIPISQKARDTQMLINTSLFEIEKKSKVQFVPELCKATDPYKFMTVYTETPFTVGSSSPSIGVKVVEGSQDIEETEELLYMTFEQLRNSDNKNFVNISQAGDFLYIILFEYKEGTFPVPKIVPIPSDPFNASTYLTDELDSLEEDLGVVPVDSIQLNNGNMLLLCM